MNYIKLDVNCMNKRIYRENMPQEQFNAFKSYVSICTILKKGDKLILRSDLCNHVSYGTCGFVPGMLKGVEVTINILSRKDDVFKIKGCDYYYSYAMVDWIAMLNNSNKYKKLLDWLEV